MTIYYSGKKTQSWYGEAIGILILDAHYPCVPGNVGNAKTFPFPVRYEEVKGASINRLIRDRDPTLVEPFTDAARELEARGVKAISGACGFMALFQEEVQNAVSIPVCLSSLSQIPFIYAITKRPVGILTADKANLTRSHFDAVSVANDTPLVIHDMKQHDEFRTAILEEKGTLDDKIVEQEAIAEALLMKKDNPDIGAILLECSDLPPYAKSIQLATGLPVFDYVTMINYVAGSFLRERYNSSPAYLR